MEWSSLMKVKMKVVLKGQSLKEVKVSKKARYSN